MSWSDPCVVHASSSLEMTFPATNPTRNMTRFYQISQCKLSLKIRNNFIDALKISPSYIRLFGKDPWIQMHTCENWDIRQYGKLQHQSCVNIGCVWFHKKNMHFLRLNQNWEIYVSSTSPAFLKYRHYFDRHCCCGFDMN